MPTGYLQSKWVAEHLIEHARNRGLKIYNYRLGNITGDSITGVCNFHDFFIRMLKTCYEVGSIPAQFAPIDIVPVDFAVKAIVALSLDKQINNNNFHIINPQPVFIEDLYQWSKDINLALNMLTLKEWIDQITIGMEDNIDHPLYSLLPILGKNQTRQTEGLLEVFAKRPSFICKHTMAILNAKKLFCPKADNNLFNTYYHYLIKTGYIKSINLATA